MSVCNFHSFDNSLLKRKFNFSVCVGPHTLGSVLNCELMTMERQNCLMVLVFIILGAYSIILGACVFICGAFLIIFGAYSILLYRHGCFTEKYTTRKIHKNYIRDPSGLFLTFLNFPRSIFTFQLNGLVQDRRK